MINKIVVDDLGQMEAAQLKKISDAHKVAWEEDKLKQRGLLGDMSTLSLALSYSPYAFTALSIWLLRRTKSKSFRKTIKVVDENGKEKEETIEIHEHSAEPPKAAVITALARLFEIDKKAVAEEIDKLETDDK